MKDDVLVVGGGVIGLSCAWRLAERGLKVALIDAGHRGWASWAAGGMLAPVSELALAEAELALISRLSLERYPQFVADLEAASAQSVGYDQTGTLLVALDQDEARRFKRLLELQERFGLPATWLNGRGARELEPMLSPRTIGAIHSPQDHQVDTRAFVTALQVAADRAGCKRHKGEVRRLSVANGRCHGVELADGSSLEAGLILVAAGAWSSGLDGIPPGLAPPIRPVKGQMLALQMDTKRPLLRHVIRGRRAYLVPRSDGRLLVGATSEEQGFDSRLTAGGLFELLRGVYELVPGSYELEFIEAFTGFRPASGDNLPILGASGLDGLMYATGHYRAGILLTPLTAWAIATAVCDGALPQQLAGLTMDRFSSAVTGASG